MGLDLLQSRGGVDIAGQHQHRAVGPVVSLVEGDQVVEADPRHVFRPAQYRIAIGVFHVAGQLMHLVEPGLGRLDLPGALLADDLPLGLDLVHIETRQRHPVGLDLQRQLPAVRRKHEPEVRAVLAGLGVRLSSRDERELVDLALRESFGPLEQHVFEEVRQPRLARRLVKRADRIEKVADDDGYLPARQDQSAQAVVQNPLEYRQIADPGSRGAGLESSSHVRAAPRSLDDKRTSWCPAPAASRKQRRASGLAGPTPARMRRRVTMSQYCIIGRRQIHTRSQGRYWFYAIPSCLGSGGSAMVTTCGFVDVSLSASALLTVTDFGGSSPFDPRKAALSTGSRSCATLCLPLL